MGGSTRADNEGQQHTLRDEREESGYQLRRDRSVSPDGKEDWIGERD